ncbi:acyl-CoA dehydrogenase family protein [Streptomyces diacarni]|uniref:acyl-CoA dehydrogenase family protein n=1 Tax=Streptomyces diacarni TaxID=2800381 RepID=UPI0033E18743
MGERRFAQDILVEQLSFVMASRALAREAARSYLDGTDRRIGPSAAKLVWTESAGKVADLTVRIHEGSDYSREVPVERIYRDVRVLRLYEGTSGAQRLFIGRNLMRQEKPSRS